MTLLRSQNQRQILDLLRAYPGITAPAAARKIGIRTATSLYILKAFKEQGLVYTADLEYPRTRGGKPARKWFINGNFGLIAGIDLRLDRGCLLILDFTGKIIGKLSVFKERESNAADILDEILLKVPGILEKQVGQTPALLGVGISLSDKLEKNLDRWDVVEAEWREILQEKLNTDVNMHICSCHKADSSSVKWIWGIPGARKTVLYIDEQADMAALQIGLIQNGRLHTGRHQQAGGAVQLFDEAEWLQLFSEVHERFPGTKLELRLTPGGIRPGRPGQLMEASGPERSVVQFINGQIGEKLFTTLNLLQQVFDPDIIIMGPELSEFHDDLATKWRNEGDPEKKASLERSSYGEYTSAAGAAVLVMEDIIGAQR